MGRFTSGNNKYYEEYNGVCPHCKQSLKAYCMPSAERIFSTVFSFGGFSYLSHRVEECIFSKEVQDNSCEEIRLALNKLPVCGITVTIKPLEEFLRTLQNSDRKPTYVISGYWKNEKHFTIDYVDRPYSIKSDIEFALSYPEHLESRKIVQEILKSFN